MGSDANNFLKKIVKMGNFILFIPQISLRLRILKNLYPFYIDQLWLALKTKIYL